MSLKQETVLLILYSVLFFIIGIVVFGLKVAPLFSAILVFAVGAIMIFILSESENFRITKFKWLHKSAENENRFWIFISFLVSCGLFFASDSPLVYYTGNRIPATVSWLCVMMLTYAAHIHDRNRKRDDLITERSVPQSPSVIEIEGLLQGIDNPWISSTIANLFVLPRVLSLESQIIKIFKEADTEDLNKVSNCEYTFVSLNNKNSA